MTKKLLLKELNKAIWNYRFSLYIPFLRRVLNTDAGLCRYFSMRYEDQFVRTYLIDFAPQSLICYTTDEKLKEAWFDYDTEGIMKRLAILEVAYAYYDRFGVPELKY